MSTLIRAYGDRENDGLLQIAFTLPVPIGPRAKEAARVYAEKLGLSCVQVAAMEAASDTHSFFVVYGHADLAIDFDEIVVPVVEVPNLSMDELAALVAREVGRKIVVVGACIGSDAHTVGIDAIMNMKGFAGDYGLERYPCFRAINLGAQVEPAEYADRIVEIHPDAVLVSVVVTQRDIDKDNARELIERCTQSGSRQGRIFVLGGPRMDHKTALGLGYDAGFGTGTRPSEVANYLVHKFLGRIP